MYTHPQEMVLLEDVLAAHAYAQESLEGADNIQVKDSPDELAEVLGTVLWSIAGDKDEPKTQRYEAAVAQYIFSTYSKRELKTAIETDQKFRGLLDKAMDKEDWLARPHRDAVFKDCLLELARLLGRDIPPAAPVAIGLQPYDMRDRIGRFIRALEPTQKCWNAMAKFQELMPDEEPRFNFEQMRNLTNYIFSETAWIGVDAADILAVLACPELESTSKELVDQRLLNIAKRKIDVEHPQKQFRSFERSHKI